MSLNFLRKTPYWIWLAALGSLGAQDQISSVRVFTKPSGAQFIVDGQVYISAASFLWPAGSKHVLSADPLQTNLQPKTRYSFTGWLAGTVALQPPTNTVVITADPSIGVFEADFTLEYAISLSFFQCGDAPCQSPGTVWVNGAPYTQSAEIYATAGSSVAVQASPNPGYVFLGWTQGVSSPGQAFVGSFVLNGPTGLYPRFQVARRIQFQTDPEGLQLLADRTAVLTPATLEWGWNTVHTLGPLSPQQDRLGNTWVFDSWSDGSPAVHAYTVAPTNLADTVTARYIPAARLSFLTDPPGLKLRVDGRENWQSYNFSWGVGETHPVEAPLQQTDAQGRKYVFRGWSNGVTSAAQPITVIDADLAGGRRLTALYDVLGRITIQSGRDNISMQVDGQDCPTPCTIERPLGARVRIVAPASVAVSESSRLDFQGWSDGAGADRTMTMTADVQNLTASYRVLNRLLATSDPPEGAGWRFEPRSPDNFYDTQIQVVVSLESRPGFRFRRWEGDLTGAFSSGTLSMAAPRTVLAVLDRVPFVPPSGLRNAAGETPDGWVAPGSVASVFGLNLAPRVEIGPDSPLVQTLADVTVRLGDRLLPLFFVSPGQVNLQIPSDLDPGPYSLMIVWPGAPAAKADFTVARNAPGLFERSVDGHSFAMAAHEDGSPVSPDSPARRDELLTLYGTGFGPYDRVAPDGFAVPQGTSFALVDPMELVLGDSSLQPVFAGASVGQIGVNAVRFRIGDAGASGSVELKARVNGHESNTVLLPIE